MGTSQGANGGPAGQGPVQASAGGAPASGAASSSRTGLAGGVPTGDAANSSSQATGSGSAPTAQPTRLVSAGSNVVGRQALRAQGPFSAAGVNKQSTTGDR